MAFRGCQRSTWAGLGRPARARAATVDKLDVPAPPIKGVAVRGNRVVQHASDKGRPITRARGDRRSFQKRTERLIRASRCAVLARLGQATVSFFDAFLIRRAHVCTSVTNAP